MFGSIPTRISEALSNITFEADAVTRTWRFVVLPVTGAAQLERMAQN